MNTNKRNQAALFLLALLWTVSSFAQEFTPDLADEQNKQAFFLRSHANTNAFLAAEMNEWSATNFVSQYGFGYTHSYINGSTTIKNSGSLSAMIYGPGGFSVLPTLAVSGSTVKSISGVATAEALAINPSVQVGHNVPCQLFGDKSSLKVVGTVGYTAADNNSLGASKVTFSQMSGWKFGAGLNYTVRPNSDVQFSLSPSYYYSQSETANASLGTTSSTYQGNLAVKFGVLYKISDSLGISTFATWLRSINYDNAPGQNETAQDWAQFGADLRYNWTSNATLDIGYTYDAFNPYYFTHAFTAQLTFNF